MTPHLTRFILASTALHGAVLLIVSSPATWLAGQAETVLSVSLTAPDDGARPSRARPEERSHAAAVRDRDRTSRPDIAPLAERGTVVSPAEPEKAMSPGTSFTASAQETAPAAASSRDTAIEQVRAKIMARLRTRLARHFEYPYVARLRGWEGEVLLAFRIEGDGRLEDIRVARGSGFAVLDDSALNSLAGIERLEEARAWLNGNRLDMQLAVVYRLRE